MDQDFMRTLQEKYGLSYHVSFSFLAEEMVGLKGKRVLEVGGSLPDGFVTENLQAEQWVALEETDYWTETLSTGHVLGTPPPLAGTRKLFAEAAANELSRTNLFYGGIEDLPDALAGHFDVVFSIAAFEHIARLPLALEKMYRALKPGGKLFTMFSPVWSSYNGHHLPEIVDDHGKSHNFGNSPIPPWGHLLLRPTELYDVLRAGCGPETAREIVYFVYNSPHINRFFLDDFVQMVLRSSFKAVQISPLFPVTVPEEVEKRLRSLYPGRTDFTHNGLLLVLEHPL